MSARVGPAALVRPHVALDEAGREAQGGVDRSHPLGVAPRQVVVEGEDVNAAAVERPQRHRQRGGERLALAGLHLDDAAVRHGQPGHDLLVERPLGDGAAGRFAHEAEHQGQPLPRLQQLPRLDRGRSQLGVATGREAVGRRAHRGQRRVEAAQIEIHWLAAPGREVFPPGDGSCGQCGAERQFRIQNSEFRNCTRRKASANIRPEQSRPKRSR